MNRLHVLIVFLLPLLVVSCNGKQEKTTYTVDDINNPVSTDATRNKEIEKLPVITFEKNIHDFGKVIQGERLSYVFKFTNTGKSNLIIENTTASCGCTTTIPPKAPIRPGETGEIKVTFDSKTKEGKVSNMVVVMANTHPVHTIIKVEAEVVKP
jgi:hypothetical protein